LHMTIIRKALTQSLKTVSQHNVNQIIEVFRRKKGEKKLSFDWCCWLLIPIVA
jgi:hypothetical protein